MKSDRPKKNLHLSGKIKERSPSWPFIPTRAILADEKTISTKKVPRIPTLALILTSVMPTPTIPTAGYLGNGNLLHKKVDFNDVTIFKVKVQLENSISIWATARVTR